MALELIGHLVSSTNECMPVTVRDQAVRFASKAFNIILETYIMQTMLPQAMVVYE